MSVRPQTAREIRRLDVAVDVSALIPALGLRPGEDSFVLLEGAGWGSAVLAFEPERGILADGESPPFEALR